MSSIKKKLKELAFAKYSPYVKDYLFRSNVMSSIYLSLVVVALEIWMLITVLTGAIFSDGNRGFLWLVKHTSSYLVLLFTAIVMFVYSVAYLKGKIKNQKIGIGIRLFFTLVSISFGLYISYISYDRTG